MSRLGLGARADTRDFRDNMYRPTLVEVPEERRPELFRALGVPVLDQGASMKCTGYALSTVANALLRMRDRHVGRATLDVSADMIYTMARRYDEFPGTRHQGSSIRGAMKGWHRHGACAQVVWDSPEVDGVTYGPPGVLTRARAREAAARPLGAYFRVDPSDLNAVHCALTEVGVLIAAIDTHDGWFDLFHPPAGESNATLDLLVQTAAALPESPPIGPAGARHRKVNPEHGHIPWPAPNSLKVGLHAVAVVGYDREGIWIQNSLGKNWGDGGFAHLTWTDWLENTADAWVARLGAPVQVGATRARGGGANQAAARGYSELRPHVLAIGPDGGLQDHGTWATDTKDLGSVLRDELKVASEGWKKRRLLVSFGSGVGRMDDVVREAADLLPTLMGAETYPLHVLANADFGARIEALVDTAWRERVSNGSSRVRGDTRIDDSLEALVRRRGGWSAWDQLKRVVQRSEAKDGGLHALVDQLDKGMRDATLDGWPFEVHVLAESTGAWMAARFVALLTAPKEEGGRARPIGSVTFVAPACTLPAFATTVLPALDAGRVGRVAVVTLDDVTEANDGFGGVYRGSFLQLVSNALEDDPRIPPETIGTPLLGIRRHLIEDPVVGPRFAAEAPNLRHLTTHRAGLVDLADGRPVHGRLAFGAPTPRRALAENLDIPEIRR